MQDPSVTLTKPERKAWEKFYRDQKYPWKGENELEDFIKYIKKGSLVLDVGSGTGKSSKRYSELFNIVLLDFSMNSLRNAYNSYEKVLGDVRNLPFKNCSFDGIIAVHILEHIPIKYIQKSVEEMYRILKKDGYIFVDVFSVEDFRFGKGEEIEKNTFLRKTGIFTHYFYDDELINILNKFNLIKIEKKIIKRKIFNNIYKKVDLVYIGSK